MMPTNLSDMLELLWSAAENEDEPRYGRRGSGLSWKQ